MRKKVSRVFLSGPGRLLAGEDFDVDILARSQARQFLVFLLEAEQQGRPYLNVGEVETGLPLGRSNLIPLRDYCLHWKLIHEEQFTEGRKVSMRIRLTDNGREVAKNFQEARRRTHGNKPVRQPREKTRN